MRRSIYSKNLEKVSEISDENEMQIQNLIKKLKKQAHIDLIDTDIKQS
jgi:hypothetical protein